MRALSKLRENVDISNEALSKLRENVDISNEGTFKFEGKYRIPQLKLSL